MLVICFPPVLARETAELEGSSVAFNVVLPLLPPLPGGEVCSCWENLNQTGTDGQSGCAPGEDSTCLPASSVSHQHYRTAFSKLLFVGSSLRPERILASTLICSASYALAFQSTCERIGGNIADSLCRVDHFRFEAMNPRRAK